MARVTELKSVVPPPPPLFVIAAMLLLMDDVFKVTELLFALMLSTFLLMLTVFAVIDDVFKVTELLFTLMLRTFLLMLKVLALMLVMLLLMARVTEVRSVDPPPLPLPPDGIATVLEVILDKFVLIAAQFKSIRFEFVLMLIMFAPILAIFKLYYALTAVIFDMLAFTL